MPESIPVQPIQQEAAPTPAPRKKSRILFIIGAVIAGFILGVGASTVLFTTNRTNTPLHPTPALTIVSTSPQPTTPPLEFVPYTNEKYGYSFRYPSTLMLKTGKEIGYNTGWESYFFVPRKSSSSATTRDVVLQINNITKVRPGITVKEYFDEMFTATPAAQQSSSVRFQKVKNLTLAGKKAIEAYQDDVFGNQTVGFTSHSFYILKDDSLIIEIEALVYKAPDGRSLDTELQEILSSFTFIDPTSQKIPPAALTPIVCTMEAMVCPDGSTVGRQGPKCDFAPCPPAK